MWEGLGRGAEGHGAADVVAARQAELAGAAGHADLESDAVAHGELGGRVGADARDDACGLVAEGEGLADLDVAVAEVAEVVQVGAAEAGGLYGDEDFFWGEGGERSVFLGWRVSGVRLKVCEVVVSRHEGRCVSLTTLRSFAPWSTDARTVCVAML